MIDTHLDLEASMETFQTGAFEQEYESVKLWKLPQDMARYEAVLEKTQPQVVVESGTRWGGTALWFAARVPSVITVDIDDSLTRDAREHPLASKVVWITGSSVRWDIAHEIKELTTGLRTMVTLDSDHHAPHVLEEIKLYGELVSPGCYLVVEDGIFDLVGVDGKIGGSLIPSVGGPLSAISATLATSEVWERDLDIETMDPVTHSPAGWWRKRYV